MADYFIKPIIVISKCLEFDACRYNGVMISDPFVKALKPFVNFIPICPEVEIGLGVPRSPIRIIEEGGKRLLYQNATGYEFSGKMTAFTSRFLDSLGEVDGFILKFKSPSCGIGSVKIYKSLDAQMPAEKGSGFFGGEIVSRFGRLAVEDEGRLRNFNIRDNFLTKIYTYARFRKLKEKPSMQKLIAFHSTNKLLFMAYNQSKTRKLGAIVANHDHLEIEQLLNRYQDALFEVMKNAPKQGSYTNMLEHAFGGVSEKLSAPEKRFFINAILDYKMRRAPISVPLKLVHSWALRFESEYLLNQTFLERYPFELMDLSDSGRGRDC